MFVRGRVAAEDDKASKLICEKIYLFTDIPRELWIQFTSMEEYMEKEEELSGQLRDFGGKDAVVVYLKKERAMKKLPPGQRVSIDALNMEEIYEKFGKENVRVLEKSIDKM